MSDNKIKTYAILALELMSVGAPADIVARVHDAGRIALSLREEKKETSKAENKVNVRTNLEDIGVFLAEMCVLDVLDALQADHKSIRGEKIILLACISWHVLRWSVSKSSDSRKMLDAVSNSFRKSEDSLLLKDEMKSSILEWSSLFLHNRSFESKDDLHAVLMRISAYEISSPQRAKVIVGREALKTTPLDLIPV